MRFLVAVVFAIVILTVVLSAAKAIEPQAEVTFSFFCIIPEPMLEALAVDAAGDDPEPVFERGVAAGVCGKMGFATAQAVEKIASAFGKFTGRQIEIWSVRDSNTLLYVGFLVDEPA